MIEHRLSVHQGASISPKVTNASVNSTGPCLGEHRSRSASGNLCTAMTFFRDESCLPSKIICIIDHQHVKGGKPDEGMNQRAETRADSLPRQPATTSSCCSRQLALLCIPMLAGCLCHTLHNTCLLNIRQMVQLKSLELELTMTC